MVTKAVLAKEIRRKSGVSYGIAASCVDVLISSLARALAEGETVELRGLGTFSVATVAKRKTALPESPVVPSHGRIVFRPSEKLRGAAWNSGQDHASFSV
jgi:integration host factor subunit beta